MIKLLLIPSSDYLGHPFPQRHNQIFERLHDEKNFEVHVVRFRLFDETRIKTELVVHELEGKRVSHLARYYLVNSLNHAIQIRKIVNKEGIDIVVLSNLATPFAYTMMESISNSDIPVIFDLPDYYPTSAAGYVFNIRKIYGKLVTGMFDFILRYMLRRATLVTSASHILGVYARMVGAHNVVHVPNGIAECFLKMHYGNDLRKKFGYIEEDLVSGYIGSLEFWLDMKSFIKGIGMARKRGIPVKLLIVGGKLHTRYSQKVEQWIKQENIQKHTKFTDFIPHDDVPKYISALDVGTIPFDISNPTAYYAAPNKMWEYLSQKKPVISTPIPELSNHFDCILAALTPGDYARQLFLIAKRKKEIYQKVEIGYRKALDQTWKNSARLFESLCYSIVNHAC